jgi:hypothetical protein
MAKIGRNVPCPCGSGKNVVPATSPAQISVCQEVEKLQEAAIAGKETLKSIGVFIFLSTADGDGWLLELSDKDALQVAKGGEKISVEISESEESIEVNWSHRFEIKNKKFTTTAYADETVEVHQDVPHSAIRSAIQRLNRSFSNQHLSSLHLD